MTAQRFLLGAAAVLTALLLQLAVIGRLPLPGAAPDLLLVLVVGFALAEGPLAGIITGFVAGLLADSVGDHQLGRLALAYVVVGYVTGLLQDDTERSTLRPFLAVAFGAVAGLTVYAGEAILLGDSRIGVHAIVRSAISTVPYDVILTPFVVPVVTGLVRRLDPDPLRRL